MSRELQTLNGQNKLALWAGRISECRNSGQNVKTWCRENGICELTYYKWQRRLLEMAQAQPEVFIRWEDLRLQFFTLAVQSFGNDTLWRLSCLIVGCFS